jgi:hypothetical protein
MGWHQVGKASYWQVCPSAGQQCVCHCSSPESSAFTASLSQTASCFSQFRTRAGQPVLLTCPVADFLPLAQKLGNTGGPTSSRSSLVGRQLGRCRRGHDGSISRDRPVRGARHAGDGPARGAVAASPRLGDQLSSAAKGDEGPPLRRHAAEAAVRQAGGGQQWQHHAPQAAQQAPPGRQVLAPPDAAGGAGAQE